MDHARRNPLSAPLNAESKVGHDSTTTHVCIQMRAGILAIQDANPYDVDAYVNYWHHSGQEIKKLLGIDQEKLGNPQDSRERFLKMIRVPGIYQANVIFSISLNNRVIGYTNVNRHGPDENYIHLHTYRSAIRSTLRAQQSDPSRNIKTGAGVAGVVIGLMMDMYLRLFPVRRLVLQTKPENRWINRALDLYLLPVVTKYVDRPAGLAAPGVLHLRYVGRTEATWMLRRAKFLSIGQADCQVIDTTHGRLAPTNDPEKDQAVNTFA